MMGEMFMRFTSLAGQCRSWAAGAMALLTFLFASSLAASPMDAPMETVAREIATAPHSAPEFLAPPFDRVPAKGKAIFVNVPSFELIAFQDGREVLRSRTVVGTKKDPTPDLTAETSAERSRPTCRPTPSLSRAKRTR